MKFRSLLIVSLLILSSRLFGQVPCGKLTVDSIYPNEDNPKGMMVKITNHDTDLIWSPRLIAILDASNDTLISSTGCGCVVLFPRATGDFPLNLVKPFTISANFSCKTILIGSDGVKCEATFKVQNASVPVVNKLNLSLFPNPVSDHLSIQVSNASKGSRKIVIVNLQGRSLYSDVLIGSKNTLDVSIFKPGIYFVQIYNNGLLEATDKLVVE